MDVFEELASAMESNRHVKKLNLANVGLTDKPARALASMLKKNKTLEKLNAESNFITGVNIYNWIRIKVSKNFCTTFFCEIKIFIGNCIQVFLDSMFLQ